MKTKIKVLVRFGCGCIGVMVEDLEEGNLHPLVLKDCAGDGNTDGIPSPELDRVLESSVASRRPLTDEEEAEFWDSAKWTANLARTGEAFKVALQYVEAVKHRG